jgi:Uma2 family endonuclease
MATRSTAPVGETLHNVEWATYCKLRDDPANDHLRMTYVDGDLTIVSPRLVHNVDALAISFLVIAVARAYRTRFVTLGTTMLLEEGRVPMHGTGNKCFEAFYLGDDVARIRNRRELDLSIDPPPSLAIEVGNASSSEASLPTFAGISVPEVWRFDAVDRTLWFGRLVEGHYKEVGRSKGLPRLTPKSVIEALDARIEVPDFIQWLDWLEPWARSLQEAD